MHPGSGDIISGAGLTAAAAAIWRTGGAVPKDFDSGVGSGFMPRAAGPALGLAARAGACGLNNRGFDVATLFAAGPRGLLMPGFGYPVPRPILGAALGPMAEKNLRIATMPGHGDLTALPIRRFSAAAPALAVLCAGWMLLAQLRPVRSRHGGLGPRPAPHCSARAICWANFAEATGRVRPRICPSSRSPGSMSPGCSGRSTSPEREVGGMPIGIWKPTTSS